MLNTAVTPGWVILVLSCRHRPHRWHPRRKTAYAPAYVREDGEDPAGERRAADAPSQAISHPVYREWASEALGDERQVYARSTMSSSEALVFLPQGAADHFRGAARRHELICPVPGCPSPFLTTRGPARRRHHFVHLQAPNDRDHQRAYVRRVAIELLG